MHDTKVGKGHWVKKRSACKWEFDMRFNLNKSLIDAINSPGSDLAMTIMIIKGIYIALIVAMHMLCNLYAEGLALKCFNINE